MALKTMAAMVDNQKDCLDIIIDATGSLMVKILTVHGQFIKTINKSLQGGTVSVSLSDLSSGDYVVNIFKDNSFLRSMRICKN